MTFLNSHMLLTPRLPSTKENTFSDSCKISGCRIPSGMSMLLGSGDVRAVLHAAAAAIFNPIRPREAIQSADRKRRRAIGSVSVPSCSYSPISSSSSAAKPYPTSRFESQKKGDQMPPNCTADELHYVDVPGTDWRIALWRYTSCADVRGENFRDFFFRIYRSVILCRVFCRRRGGITH